MIDKSLQNIQDVSNKKSSLNIVNISDINRRNIIDGEESLAEEHIRDNERGNIYDKSIHKILATKDREHTTDNFNKNIENGNIYEIEFKKQVLSKLNKITYKIDILDNKICMLEEKMQSSNYFNQECDFQFPITTLSELTHFEEQLKDTKFKNQVIATLKLVGGSTTHVMIRNLLKKSITNELAQHFSWAGKKKKRSFKELTLATILIQAVRTVYSNCPDNDISEYAAKWLAQANLRMHRERKTDPLEADEEEDDF